MRRDELYLNDIVEGADHIVTFIAGVDFEAFQKSEMMRSAVVHKLAVIGEAAARISQDLKQRHTEIPWPQIAAFRNILVHAYISASTGMKCGAPLRAGVPICASWLRQ